MMPDVDPVVPADGADAVPNVTVVPDAPLVPAPTEPDAAPSASPTDASTDVPADPSGVENPPPERPMLRPPPGPHDRIRKIAAIAFIAVVVVGAGGVTLTRSPFFFADTIDVRGMSHVDRAAVLRVAQITPKTNVFTLDAGAAEARLERDPWIAEATITKDLPSALVIDIVERYVVAVVESGGVLRLVADDGVLLEAALPSVANGLPVIAATQHGVEPEPTAVAGAARAVTAMSPSLRQRIDGVSILASGSLRVDLASGAMVAYGESTELPEKAMALRALLDYALGRGATVVSADVRVPSAPTAVLSGGEVVSP